MFIYQNIKDNEVAEDVSGVAKTHMQREIQ